MAACRNQVGFDKQILRYMYMCVFSLQKSSYNEKISQEIITEISVMKVKLMHFLIAHACLLQMF